MCVCVCERERGRERKERNLFVLCTVMSAVLVPSKNSLETLHDLGTAFREFCITEHNQAVRNSVHAERYFRLRSTGQTFIFFYQIYRGW